MSRDYRVNVARDDKWWMVTVPELDGYVRPDGSRNLSDTTQARSSSEVEAQALDFICTVTEEDPADVTMTFSYQ